MPCGLSLAYECQNIIIMHREEGESKMFDKPIGKLVAHFRFVLNTIRTPIPPNSYQPGASFVKRVRSSLAVGNVSMGVGRMFSKEDHERLYASLKDHKFTE